MRDHVVPPLQRRPAPLLHRAATAVVAALVLGAALGIGTQVLQGWLPGSWGVIANSGVAWALAAFGLGTLIATDRLAAPAGAITLVIASISYYQAVDWFEDVSSGPRGAILWSVAGIVAGPVFAVGGRWARSRPDRRHLAWSLVAGTLLGEGIHLTWLVGVHDLWPAGVVELLIGLLVVVGVLLRLVRGASADRGAGVAAIAVTAAALAATLIAGRLIDHGFATL